LGVIGPSRSVIKTCEDGPCSRCRRRSARISSPSAGAAALPAGSRIARAQAYPTRPVRIVVPFTPGGASDITARLIGQWLSERLGQQFVIDNRPGGGTNIGTEAVVRAPADGYTLLMVGGYNAINATLYDKLNFNFIRDIAPVAGIIVVPNVMVVNLWRGRHLHFDMLGGRNNQN
jgi:tripartite-type tricarboxylate transporter receptor subunit TctC